MTRARGAGDPPGIPPSPGRFGRALGFLLALGLLAPGIPSAGTGQDDGRKVSPHLNAYYLDADYERWKAVFERPGRELLSALSQGGIEPDKEQGACPSPTA